MQTREASNDFFIWGIDDSPYGPVELPVLVDWVRDERVLPETWVYRRLDGSWRRASDVPELQILFKRKAGAGAAAGAPAEAISPGTLRRIKILGELNDAQLHQLAQFIELVRVPQFSVIVKQGETGDAMFMVLEGEVRARVSIGGKETILATFGPGEFFGDMALFDNGPRSADVVANSDSVLFKMTATAFARLTQETPALATPFLQATARTLAARIRADNKRLDRITQQFRNSGVSVAADQGAAGPR